MLENEFSVRQGDVARHLRLLSLINKYQCDKIQGKVAIDLHLTGAIQTLGVALLAFGCKSVEIKK